MTTVNWRTPLDIRRYYLSSGLRCKLYGDLVVHMDRYRSERDTHSKSIDEAFKPDGFLDGIIQCRVFCLAYGLDNHVLSSGGP